MWLMNLSLLLKQCLTWLVCLTWMVFEKGAKWTHSCCFEGIACRICSKQHVAFLCNSHLAFSPCILLTSMKCSRIDTAKAWKKSHFIISNFYIIYNLSIAVHAFIRLLVNLLSVDEILLLKDVLFHSAFNGPLAEFTNMLWVIILHEYKYLTHKSHSRWDHVMLQYAVIASLIQFAFHLMQIPNLAIGKSPLPITQPPPSFMIGVIQGVAALSTIHTQTFLVDQKILTLNSQPKGLCSTALCVPWLIEDFWHCFATSTTVSSLQFCHIGQLHRDFSSHWMLTLYFTTLVQLCSDVWCSQPFCHASWWLMKLSSA